MKNRILSVILFVGFVSSLPAQNQDQAALKEILGSNPLTWQFSQPGSIKSLDGHTVLVSGAQPLTLSGSEMFPVDVEYRLVCRFIPPPGGNASVHFQIGLKGPADATAITSGGYLSGNANLPYVQWYVASGSNAWKCNGYYFLKAINTRSLAWPEAPQGNQVPVLRGGKPCA